MTMSVLADTYLGPHLAETIARVWAAKGPGSDIGTGETQGAPISCKYIPA